MLLLQAINYVKNLYINKYHWNSGSSQTHAKNLKGRYKLKLFNLNGGFKLKFGNWPKHLFNPLDAVTPLGVKRYSVRNTIINIKHIL
jgi:hypothetical protein